MKKKLVKYTRTLTVVRRKMSEKALNKGVFSLISISGIVTIFKLFW